MGGVTDRSTNPFPRPICSTLPGQHSLPCPHRNLRLDLPFLWRPFEHPQYQNGPLQVFAVEADPD